MKLNTIYNEDCLEGMKRIPDKSVDMILCDLPYGTTRNKWDEIIPLDKLWEQYERIITDVGAIVLTAQTPFDKVLGTSNLNLLKGEWIWKKNRATGHMLTKFAPLKQHENILVFSKGRTSHSPLSPKPPISYYPQGVVERERPIKTKYKRSINQIASYGERKYRDGEAGFDGYGLSKTTNFPKSILEFDCETGLHPTQKPVALFEYLIKTYTNKGDTVLDNCMGSGTTAIACLNTDRQYIGFELDEGYYNIAQDRIKNHEQQLNT